MFSKLCSSFPNKSTDGLMSFFSTERGHRILFIFSNQFNVLRPVSRPTKTFTILRHILQTECCIVVISHLISTCGHFFCAPFFPSHFCDIFIWWASLLMVYFSFSCTICTHLCTATVDCLCWCLMYCEC